MKLLGFDDVTTEGSALDCRQIADSYQCLYTYILAVHRNPFQAIVKSRSS